MFADLHDNLIGLHAVLDDAQAQQVDRFIFLGDAGHHPRIFAALQAREMTCIYGNWEVSGLRRLPEPLAEWVGSWPALLCEDGIAYCHASPEMPVPLPTAAAAAAWLKPGMSWSALFPRLHQNTGALWNALAWMQSHRVHGLFHGHTHVQLAWVWSPTTNKLRSLAGPAILQLSPTERTIIGVGSAGVPEDGGGLCYAIYDDEAGIVELRRIEEKGT